MSAAMQEADNSIRERVVHSIPGHGSSTAREFVERLNLTPATTRRYLSALLEEGVLGSREQWVHGACGRGCPSKVFFLTDTGRSELHQAYDELAIVVIRRLIEAAGPQAMVGLASERTGKIKSRFNELRETHPERTPIELLTETLGATYAPSVKPVRSGDQLCRHHCPAIHVTIEFPQPCEVETQPFLWLLGSHVQWLVTIAHGNGVRTTHIPNPVTPSKIKK